MLKARKAKARFSNLLLDEGEEYEGDYVAVLSTPKEYAELGTELKGRLRICSMSIVFDPTNLAAPVMKFPLRDAASLIPASNQSGGKDRMERFTMTTTSFTSMKPNNLDVPYKSYRHPRGGADWVFALVYASLEQVLPQLHEALYLSQQSRHDLIRLLRERQAQKLSGKGNTFDTAMYLRDAIAEKIFLSVPCVLQAPLVHSPGRLVVTTECVYFQQLHDIDGNSPCKIHQIKDILGCCKKKFKLRERVALELLFWKPKNSSAPKWDTSSAFFAFQSRQECHRVWEALTRHEQLGEDTPIGNAGAKLTCKLFSSALRTCGQGESLLDKVAASWQKGAFSNFHYLMTLNLLSGRTFNDLSQYPVFPWVVSDYTSAQLDLSKRDSFRDLSKPVGALNEERLGYLRERFSLMPADDPQNPPFLYGTHYSNPGYVMYWLVRAAPGHLLRLQSGRFDAPDRMFHSLQESWASVLSNQADVKELIPEFFVRGLGVKFLQANEALPLGCRQNGKPIDEVALPPWAPTASDFVVQHRRALDSDFVRLHLHQWVDLVWGCKQRGKAAVLSDNLFHHSTYLSERDLRRVEDEVHRDALQQQAQEFGQTPRQLFAGPHPESGEANDSGEGDGSGALEEGYLGNTSVCLVVDSLMRAGVRVNEGDMEEEDFESEQEEEEEEAPGEEKASGLEEEGLAVEKRGPPRLIDSLSSRFASFNFRKRT